MTCMGCNAKICAAYFVQQQRRMVMPNKVKWKSVDRSTFYVYDAVVYQPPLVTVGDRPLDRSDDGRWGGEEQG